MRVLFDELLPEGETELDDDALLPLLQHCPGLLGRPDLEDLALEMVEAADLKSSGAVSFGDFVAALQGADPSWAQVRPFVQEHLARTEHLFGAICLQNDRMNVNLLKNYLKKQKLASDAKQAKACAQRLLAGEAALTREQFGLHMTKAALDTSSAWHILVDQGTKAAPALVSLDPDDKPTPSVRPLFPSFCRLLALSLARALAARCSPCTCYLDLLFLPSLDHCTMNIVV